MSSDIYAKPDLSKKVRYSRNVQEDQGEWQETGVDIYESADTTGGLQSHELGPHTENPPTVHRRPFSAAALCLGLLCFLMLTGIILFSVHYISVSLEKDQLQTRYDKLSKNYSQLQVKFSDIGVNNSHLQSSYNTMRKNHSQLQNEMKQLKGKIEGKWCPQGWKRFGCSCYYKATERKTWQQSRTDCQHNGADLVVINSREEQKFVSELNMNGESWIGLRKAWETDWVWKWVDSSPLTETFLGTATPFMGTVHNMLQSTWTMDTKHI